MQDKSAVKHWSPDESSSLGDVNAFLNVCRHRGAKLLDESSQEDPVPTKRTSLLRSLPLHAWSYRAHDGVLQAIPGKEAFPCVDRSQHGL